MQGKGFIKFIAIAFGIACLYALSFTFVVRNIEKQAKAYAKGDEKKEKEYLDSMATVKVYPVLGFNYEYCKSKEINLGLDLKGGMNVTLEISLNELVKSLAGNPTDVNFNKAIDLALQETKNTNKDFITSFVDNFQKIQPNVRLADYFATQSNAQNLKGSSSNGEVKAFLQKEAESAIDRSKEIISRRIDKFGVVQPNIQRETGTNRIMVELPGVTDQERVRKLLQGTAELQFWQVYNATEVYPLLENINGIIAASVKNQKTTSETKTDTSAGAKAGSLASLAKDNKASDSVSKDNQAEKNIPLFSVLVPPTYQNEQGQMSLVPGSVVGLAQLKDTAKVNAYLRMPEVKAVIPQNMKLMWSVKPEKEGTKVFELFAIKVTTPNGKPILSGEAVSDARAGYDQNNNPDVTMYMNTEGANKWKKVTADASATDPKQAIAIVMDNSVYSAPTVQNEIPNGVSSITGNFTVNDTKDLANILKAGKLPAPSRIVGDYVVGPTLGAAAIHNGLLSFVIAFIVILIFMALYYNKAGWVANFALLVNLLFIMGVLSSLGAVLTLPGIAGIVLTIGLSVDANILIFERVREELAHGKAISLAIKEGFKHAMSSIIDSNVTILILGVILFIFGTGPVQGFATTLCVGILTSLFAAVLISRLVFEGLLTKKSAITFDNSVTRNAFTHIAFNFVGRRKLYYAISAVIIALGFVFYFKNGGLNLGIDFKGGRTYIVHFDKNMETDQVRTTLAPSFDDEAPEVKTAGAANQLKITTTYHITDIGENVDNTVRTALKTGLDKLNVKYTIEGGQKVTPVVANDIIYKALLAIGFSCLMMFVYILIQFKKWQYGLGAVIALFHDVLLVLSVYTILDKFVPFSLEIGQDFIAAILTVMGYTMTETVVVFDRIREKLSHSGKEDLYGKEREELINFALNSTLSRTILTSLTVFFVLLAIFIFGGDSIRGFIFALLIGRIIGTYSSLCISTPIVIDFGNKKPEEKK